MPDIFNNAWFWLLMFAIIMFIVGVIIVIAFQSAWGVLIIVFGVLLLIAAAIVGFVTSSRKAVVNVLNTEVGAQLPNLLNGNIQGEEQLGEVLTSVLAGRKGKLPSASQLITF
jgi:c-di-AMP phosphodiesterase-like protein